MYVWAQNVVWIVQIFVLILFNAHQNNNANRMIEFEAAVFNALKNVKDAAAAAATRFSRKVNDGKWARNGIREQGAGSREQRWDEL